MEAKEYSMYFELSNCGHAPKDPLKPADNCFRASGQKQGRQIWLILRLRSGLFSIRAASRRRRGGFPFMPGPARCRCRYPIATESVPQSQICPFDSLGDFHNSFLPVLILFCRQCFQKRVRPRSRRCRRAFPRAVHARQATLHTAFTA